MSVRCRRITSISVGSRKSACCNTKTTFLSHFFCTNFKRFQADWLQGLTTERLFPGQPIRDELHQLRKSVRSVVSEVREALYDLRTDVSESRGLTGTLEEFLRRVHERSGIDVVFEHEAVERPPIPVERELFRIAQEAVANVERHSHAKTLTVTWTCDDKVAVLELRDDGVGIEPRTAARLDAYGIVGMRERADAIGAELVIESDPGGGTLVRCRWRRS